MPEAPDATPQIFETSPSPKNSRRLFWLVALHCVAAASPALAILLPMSVAALPFLWALFAISFGGILTLAVWIGMGPGRMLRRLGAGLLASAYVAIWLTLFDYLQSNQRAPASEWVTNYLRGTALLGAIMLIFGGMFGLLGRRYRLTRDVGETLPTEKSRFQFSVLHGLVLMSVVAIVLSLSRFVRETIETNADETVWNLIAVYSLALVVYFTNVACAAFAALGMGSVKRNVALALIVSMMLGTAIGFTTRNYTVGWWLFVGSIATVVIPMLVELVSLLVVRSCGYRIVRRRKS